MRTITYQKVKYDPLTFNDAEKCLNDLFKKVYEAIIKLIEEEILHGDLRLPNICFDEEFKVVFIDFDLSDKAEDATEPEKNVWIFAKDLVTHVGSFKSDKFMLKLCDGIYNKQMLSSSPISTNSKYRASIQNVIGQRR